ncbi:hypothetical protein [Finegoldia magna]|uniref:YobI family P-loop NTPase n=1 Tax=Finegoldia magna TaxID=1260 RepID=UPI00399B8C06
MKDNINYKFHKLTPTKVDINSESYRIIEKALNQAYDDNDIKNIAITGIYGSGKSSILKTYYSTNLKKSELINVSIADFDSYLDQNSKKNDNHKDNKEDEDNSSNDLSTNYLNNSNRIKSAEKQIINQILYQIPSNKIPLSKFKVKNKRKIRDISFFSTCLILVILGILMSLKIEFIYSYFYKLLAFSNLNNVNNIKPKFFIDSFIIFSILFPLISLSIWLGRRVSIKLNKFNFKGAESELIENDNTNILDQEARELVYLIWSSGVKTVIFEDLDRFNDISIFVRLREINSLINFKSEETVRFIYVIRDDLFESKDRVKFFDLIIPVIPSMTSKNSKGKILDIFGDIEDKFSISKKVLLGLSLYIDDMRLLYSIRNEYEIYSKSIDIDKNADEIFSLIVLKNIFPKEYEELERDRGYLYEILNKRESLNTIYKKSLQTKIKEKEELKKLIVKRVSDFLAVNIPKNYRFDNTNNDSYGKIMYEWSRNKNKDYLIYNGNYGSNYKYSSFIDELCKHDDSLKNRLEEIDYDDIYIKIDSLSDEIDNLNKKINMRNSSQMSYLLNQLSDEDLMDFFEENNEVYNPITKDHYFPLIRYLLLTGLVDENYWRYKGFFYDSDIGRNDNIYISRVLSGKNIENNFKLEKPDFVLEYLKLDDYSRKDIVNYDLIELLISTDKDKELYEVFKVILQNNDQEAIEYINSYKYGILKKFTFLISKSDFSGLWLDLKNQVIPKELKLKFIGLICLNKNIETNEEFNEYVENNSNILELNYLEEKQEMLKAMKALDIKFTDVSNIEIDDNIAKFILDNNMFNLNLDNVINLLSVYLSKNKDDISKRLFRYMYDDSLLLDSLREVVISNIDNFIEKYNEFVQKNKINSDTGELAFLEILKSNLNDDYKKIFIKNEETVIKNISSLKSDKILIDLADNDLIQYNENNILEFYNNTTKVNPIINIINLNYHLEFELPNEMYIDLINSSLLNYDLFKKVIYKVSNSINSLSSDLSREKYKLLLKNNLIKFNIDNFETFLNIEELNLIVDYMDSIIKQNVTSEELIDFMNENGIIKKLSKETVIEVLNKKLLDDDSTIRLIEEYKVNVSLFDIEEASLNVRDYVLNNWFVKEDYERIIIEVENFDLWKEFINKINGNPSEWNEVIDNKLTQNFIDKIIMDDNIYVSFKIDLLNKIIRDKNYVLKWKEWISLIPDIQEIARVFDGGMPTFESEYESSISNSLESIDVVTMRTDGRLNLKPNEYKKLEKRGKN